MPLAHSPLDLRYVSEGNIQESVRAVNGYLKFASMIWIRALRQPILDGIIIRGWSAEAGRSLKGFCDRHACNELLLRIDSHNKRWSERRGGYIVPKSKAKGVVEELNKDAKIAAFLEPASPYRDRYSLAAITDDTQKTMSVDVVGPGFDASDLLRSDSAPHERFEVLVPQLSPSPRDSVFAQRTYVIDSAHYKQTVQERLTKIGARLRIPAYPRTAMDSVGPRLSLLADEAIQYLQKTRQNALLNRLNLYEPIPRGRLERFVNGVASIIAGLRRYEIRLGPTSFAGTFTQRGRFILWDFFPADLAKAKALYLNS